MYMMCICCVSHILTPWIFVCFLFIYFFKSLKGVITFCLFTVCPVCQEKYDANEVISNLSLAEHHVNLREGNKCSSCDDPSISGWCVECQDKLCAVCVAAHKRAEDTREHYVHTATPESPRPVMCRIHEQEVINSFCLMCDRLICRKCPPLHPHHLLQLSHQAVGRQRKQIRQMLQKVRQKSPSVQKSLNNLQGRLSDLEELQARLRLDVKNTVGRLCNMVLKKASKLLKEIEDVCRSEKEKIDERRTILQRLKGKQDYVLTFSEKVLDSQDYTVLLSCKKQIHRQLQCLLEQTAFPMTTMMELYFHSNELNVKKVLKAFGCIEAREVPFACSERGNASNQILTPDVQKTAPPSMTGQDSLPSVALRRIGPRKSYKDDRKGLAFSPNSSIRARLSSSSSQDNRYSDWPGSKRSWSYHPYQPRDTPRLLRSSGKAISSSDKGSLVAQTSPCEPSGSGASQAEPGSSSTWPDKTPMQPIPTFEKVASGVPSTRLQEDGELAGDQARVQTRSRSPEIVGANIQSVDSCLNAPPSGNDANNQEVKLSDPSAQPPNSNPDQSGPQKSKQPDLEGNLFCESYGSADLLNPNKAAKTISPVSARFHAASSKPDLRAGEADSSTHQNLPPVLKSVNEDDTTLQEAEAPEETLTDTMSDKCPPEYVLKREKEQTDINTLTNALQMEPAQTSTLSVSVKEQPETVEVAELSSGHSCPLKEEDDENGTPGTKIRDDKGDLVVLDSLGRDWLPRISLCRLSVRDYPSSRPPAFSVVRRKHSDGFPSGAAREDGQSVVPRCLSRPLLVKKQHCAACRISGKLIQCRVCRRAFHRECHLPLISLSKTDQWRCVLCRDLSHTGDWDVDPEPAASPCLSLYEQRKCEYLLLSLSCHKHSSALYRSATPSSPRYVDVTLVRGRLLGKLTPPYRTPAEFVSDLWLLLDTLRRSSKKALHVEHLQSFFSKQLRGVFGTGLHPSLLTDPYRGRRTEERRRRELKAAQNKSDHSC
ncbi:transcription intermediary factor 1-beta-like isoform X1 [Ictalurus furcatus]|uniref:transcription intermediary factor 1-beta-like isoform X1 n=2 Tax=Ictalurus furcatus TaxID=66913 RepID=UPI0023508B4B|nr:transcription intermediary factor 1-beta-like isoform X1 [Ictalurus furcatus]XP_053494761.1 transcription intermediary factor 1-beta-like isoform X1 [Ictalurus furcatus]